MGRRGCFNRLRQRSFGKQFFERQPCVRAAHFSSSLSTLSPAHVYLPPHLFQSSLSLSPSSVLLHGFASLSSLNPSLPPWLCPCVCTVSHCPWGSGPEHAAGHSASKASLLKQIWREMEQIGGMESVRSLSGGESGIHVQGCHECLSSAIRCAVFLPFGMSVTVYTTAVVSCFRGKI